MRSPRKLLKQLSIHRGERRRRSAENGTSQQRSGGASPRLSPNEWQFAFDHVISDADGRAQFTKFLQSEYSEENILFWWAVEELKTVCSSECRSEFERTVLEMFETFIASESPWQSISITTRGLTLSIGLRIRIRPRSPTTFTSEHKRTSIDSWRRTASPVSCTPRPTKKWPKRWDCRRRSDSTRRSRRASRPP